MKRKVLGAQEALAGGVRRVVIADGRADSPVTRRAQRRGHGVFVMKEVLSAEYRVLSKSSRREFGGCAMTTLVQSIDRN